MAELGFPFQAIQRLTFEARPRPLSAGLRPIYRIALIALVLKLNCHGHTASLIRLQFFNWVLKSPYLRRQIEQRLETQGLFSVDLVHMDPMVNLALKYAYADGLVSITGNAKYKLTDKGHELARRMVEAPDDLLQDERELLTRLGRRISETRLTRELL
jgi:hypothetical protein